MALPMVIALPPAPVLPPFGGARTSCPWPGTSQWPSRAGAGQLPLPGLDIQRAQATVAVRLERAHAQRLGQGQGLTVGGFGQLGLRGLAVRVDLAEEPQGPGLLTLLRVRAAELQATHRDCQRLVEAAEAQIRLAQPDMDLTLMISMASVETLCSSSGRASDTRPARTYA